MIKRYECMSDGQDMWEDECGSYVDYDDYKAVVDKANELLREAAKVYQMYNKTEEPDGNLVDMQTLQELSDLING